VYLGSDWSYQKQAEKIMLKKGTRLKIGELGGLTNTVSIGTSRIQLLRYPSLQGRPATKPTGCFYHIALYTSEKRMKKQESSRYVAHDDVELA
jgi:hypothetical protein